MNVKTAALMLCSVAVAAMRLPGGECTYRFLDYRNAAVRNFQVPLFLAEGKEGFSYAGFADPEGGTDLRVADNDGTLLPYEIENWTPGGESVVWVKVPEFSNSTALRLSWGDADAASAGSVTPEEFWDNALGVFHFGSSGGLNSANGEVFANKGGAVSQADAAMGKCADFDRSAVYTQADAKAEEYFPEDLTQFTLSFWLKTDKTVKGDDQTYLFQMGHVKPGTSFYTQIALLLNWDKNAGVRFYWNQSETGDWGVANKALSYPTDGKWHHLAYTYDGAKFTAYRDGAVVYESEFSGFAINAWTADGTFGLGGTSAGQHAYDGLLEEFRFERVSRSPDWIRAVAETQVPGVETVSCVIPFADYDGDVLTNFPVYVHLDGNTGLDIPAFLRDFHAGDAYVCDMKTGARLPVEFEYAYTNAFDNSVGLWVRVPEYSSSDGIIVNTASRKVYQPDVEVQNLIGAEHVWTGKNDVLVFHMNPTGRLCNAVNGSTLEMKHDDAADIVGHPVAVDGPTGPYQAYHSTTNGSQVSDITVPLSVPLTNRWTVSWWAKVDADEFASPKKETYVWVLSTLSALKGNGYKGHGAGPNKMSLFSGGKTCNLEFPDDGWHHFAYAADGANVYCYRDGELMKTASWTKDFAFTDAFSGNVNLMSSGNQRKDAFRGCGDEFRFESGCRSADWIRASYLNQLAWRNGTPWQYAPHFSGISGEVPEDGEFTATAELSCRTSSKVTFFWGVSDGGDDFRKWENSIELGSFADMESAAATVLIPSPGTRYVYRFRAVNVYGTAWSDVGYMTDPVVSKRGKRVKISVAYDGTETLKDFPLCVRIPASNSLPEDSGAVQFYDEAGRDLAWEPETWNPAGESVVWVRVPELTSRTELMMRFGGDVQNNGAWDADAVWRPDEHAGVWHFAYTGKIANPTLDSTSFGGDITTVSHKDGSFAYVTNGVAGEAFHFPKAVDSGYFYSDPNTQFNEFGSGFTFSLWLRIPDGETDDAQIFVKHESDESVGQNSGWMQYYIFYETNGMLYLTVYSKNSSIYPAFQASMAQHVKFGYNAERPDDGWHHYAFVHDGMFMRTYRDGVCLKSTFYPFVLNGGLLGGTRAQTYFGNSINHYQCAKGSIDEYRAERVGRSAAWIKACYDNQRPDSAFVTVGPTSGPGAVIVLR